MTKAMAPRQSAPVTTIRCAIYTRKSTEEGLQQEFNTLDAQRESGEAYIRSQTHEGWACLADRYDDGGYSGGNMDRPALRRLLADIEARRIDCVVVYKVDRLSRSLLDFARMMEVFEKHGIAFVAVTQQINTGSSMGRLMLNVLLSFAQFEREIISERTRDKIAAARRKGKWAGGMPLLGYDVLNTKLVVNKAEAALVRAIFELYIENQSLLPVVQELERRGWTNKLWTTRKGHERGGRPFDKTALWQLLTNVAYAGKIRHKGEVYEGEHEAIVTAELWQRVQTLLQRNGRTGGAAVRNKFGALLKGLLHCNACNCAMSPTHTTKGNRRYRYYTCTAAQKRGWAKCPAKAIPAHAIEQFVVEQLKCIGRDPAVLDATLAQARAQTESQIALLEAEQSGLDRDLARWGTEVRKLVPLMAGAGEPGTARLADLQERIRGAERRATEVRDQLLVLQRDLVDEQEIASAMAEFTPLWESLTPQEQVRVVQLLVQRVDFDGANNKVAITFHATGIKALAHKLVAQTESAA